MSEVILRYITTISSLLLFAVKFITLTISLNLLKRLMLKYTVTLNS